MTIDFFTSILAIAEEESLSRAAEKLYIHRTALNRQLLLEEERLGMPLFERINGAMVPTEAGRTYLDMARKSLLCIKEGENALSNLSDGKTGTINLGIVTGRSNRIISEVFPLFHAEYPGVTINVFSGNSGILSRKLGDGSLDLAVMSGEIYEKDEFTRTPLCLDEMLLMINAANPLAEKAHRLEDGSWAPCDLSLFREEVFGLQDRDALTYSLCTKILFGSKNRLQPKIAIRQGSASMLSSLVSQGVLCTILPEVYMRPYPDKIVAFALTPRQYYALEFVTRNGHILTKAEQRLRELLIEYHKPKQNDF